ncbi:trafficking protein particle complex subunit 10 [Cyathus striatus]|nr:trafficking protein particle complex subunit 10 [Cyathus striatus]
MSAQPLASGQRVLVSYTAPPQFIASPNWTRVFNSLLSQFPLRSIHWKSSSTTRTSVRTIQELNVTLVSLDTLRDDVTSQVPVTLLEKPLLNIYVVYCEDHDLDMYRTLVKKQIKDWHATVTSRKHQDWLILQIVRPDAQAPTGNIFQLRGSVLRRSEPILILTNANGTPYPSPTHHKLHLHPSHSCIKVTFSSGNENAAMWVELISKMKDGIVYAFDSAVTQRQEEVRRSEAQQQMPGWNFCTFFILKESLATSYEGMGLLEEALQQYNELETSFYHDMILANTISVFDFRIYLLSRQCELLAKMKRMGDLTEKVVAFLGAFGKRLGDVKGILPPFFVESWTYSSAISVVEQCDLWISQSKLDSKKLLQFNAGKGELLETARHQLDIIGIRTGHLPNEPPFSTSIPSQQGEPVEGKISNAELLKVMEDQEVFYELYVAVTKRAIEMYTESGRRKFALKMHGGLAALDLHRGRLSSALPLRPHLWTALESYVLSLALNTHGRLQKPRDSEWIHILLSYLKTYVEQQGAGLVVGEGDAEQNIGRLVEELKDAAEKLENGTFYVSSNARLADTRDGSYLDATVHNHLPCNLPAGEVGVLIAGRDEKYRFSASVNSLEPGTTNVELFCPPPYTIVRVPQDVLALDVQIEQSNRIELGKASMLMAKLSSGRNKLSKAVVKLASSNVTFKHEGGVLCEEDDRFDFEASKDSIILSRVPEDFTVAFRVPYPETAVPLKVNIEVDYTTEIEPSLRRVLRLSRALVTTLPIAVNVEDFFRGTRLISKYVVSTLTHQHVRIATASLEAPDGPEGLKISSCSSKRRGVVTVTPAQPASFLFTLDSPNGPVRDSLALTIKYRMFREEVESLIQEHVDKALENYPSMKHQRVYLINTLVDVLERDAGWVEMYSLTGELMVPEVRGEKDEEFNVLIEKIKKLLSHHQHPLIPQGQWREIRIPVDVPYMNVVAAARIRLVPDPVTTSSLYAGQPIPAIISIHTSFHWGSTEKDRSRKYAMRYNMEEMVKEWLVSGPKRGDFIASDAATFTVPITLIALHHGEFSLPKVLVTALPITREITNGSMTIPSTETYQVHGAEKVLILPRGGRTTFVVGMGQGRLLILRF